MSSIALPIGTVTFVFTDIEGSTRLVQELGEQWAPTLELHDAIVTGSVTDHGGVVVRTEGDAVFAVFEHALAAVEATVALQRALQEADWPADPLRVRVGVHTGVGAPGGADYVGLDVHRAARIAATAHGGQIVLSEATSSLVEHDLPADFGLLDLGKHRLKDLTDREAIYQVVADGLQQQFPPLSSLERIAHNLPVQVTSFVGREREIRDAVRLLQTAHVLTLLGPGGIGKSRLSLQIAAECADRFPDGAFFVPLAPVTDPKLVPSTILSALGVPASTRQQSPREHLNDFFARRSALLVLDNFEQVVEAGDVVADLVRASPQSRVLVTSRVPLHVVGEQEMPIEPLDVGGSGDIDVDGAAAIPAVHLFMDRVLAVRPDFELTAENAASVVELVRRLDGLPLAIELVVPQLRVLPVGAVLERLDPARLGGTLRDAPERHQTLWNAISWSVESLTPLQQEYLARLSVFVGGARLEEVESVCEDLELDALDALSVLIERSLVLRGDVVEDVRFRWLRVIREYATGMLDETRDREHAERRHAEAYLALAEEAFGEILGRNRRRWIEALDRDHDNVRGALHWALKHGETDMALRLGWFMWRFWQTRGHIHEARATMERILSMAGGDPRLRAKAMEAMGGILWWSGELEEADRIYREVLEIQRGIGDRRELANALYNVGLTQAYGFIDATVARQSFAEAEAIYKELGDVSGLGDVHWGIGSMAYIGSEEPAVSREMLEKAVGEYREAGNVFGEGWAHFELAALLLRIDEVEAADPHLVEGLHLLWEARDYSAVVMFVMLFAWGAYKRDDLRRAYRLIGAGYGLQDRSGLAIMSVEVNQQEGMRTEDIAALDGDLRTIYEEGRTFGYDEAVAYALEGTVPERLST